MTNDVNVASVHALIERIEIYVGEILFHLLNDELYCNNCPFDKLLNVASVHAFIEQLEIYVGEILFHLL